MSRSSPSSRSSVPAAVHVLVVDDDDALRKLICQEFAAEGHAVVGATCGAAAIEQLEQAEFDVVLCDVRLPGMSGVEVLREVKQRSSTTEVIMTTGFASLDSAVECLRAGAFDFVQKPVQLVDLLATVARAAERRRLRATTELYRASQAIFATTEPERLPQVIVEVAMSVMEADDVSLMLPATDGSLRVAYSSGLPPEVAASVRLTLGERVAGRIALDKKPALLSEALGSDPRFADVDTFGRVRSSIVYPVVAGERLVAVLNLNRSAARPFRREDLDRAAVLAAHVLLALENARLVRQMIDSERLASMGRVAAGVAHEINNPVSYVLGNLSFLRDRLGELRRMGSLLDGDADPAALRQAWAAFEPTLAELDRATSDATEGASRIGEIVRDVRALAGSDEWTRKVFDLSEAVQAALRVAGAVIRGRIQVTVRLESDLRVFASAGRLSQVFVNLLTNAAQAASLAAAKAPIEVIVSTRREGSSVVAEIADKGPGIAPEHLGRLFEPFFTTRGPAGGTGLGLWICREIVRSHGGEIGVDSALGKGTTFRIALPGTDPASAAAARPASADEPARDESARARLLFVDDEAAILRWYRRYFGRTHDVALAEGGTQALAILAERRDFDLVVSDVLMPDINGAELYRRVKEAYPELAASFVFVTGGATPNEIAELRTTGSPVLQKPIDVDLLSKIIARRSAAKTAPSPPPEGSGGE